MSEDKYRAALDAAAKQLSYRALSAKGLREKLLDKGHDEEAADYALAWLTERRLLDDTAYAQSVVRSCAHKGYGEMRIRQELTRRGVDRETAEAALTGFSPDRAQLCALLDKRLRGDVSDRKQIDKAVAFLQRRGFRGRTFATRLQNTARAFRIRLNKKKRVLHASFVFFGKTADFTALCLHTPCSWGIIIEY